MTGNKNFKTVILTISLLLGVSHLIIAQDYKQSIGIRLGTAVGASITAYTSENKSLEAFAGITRQANQTDYIFGGFYKFHWVISSDIPTLNWYAGLGILSFVEDEAGSEKFNIAPSTILGLEYTLEHAPVNFFIDVMPHYNITTNTTSKFNLHANLGARFTLNKSE